MFRRIAGAALLRSTVYRELVHDSMYDREALWVVVLASIADGAGLALAGAASPEAMSPAHLVLRIVFGGLAGVFVYYVMAFLLHYFGTTVFHGTGGADQVRRTLGFAYGPRVLGLFAFVPGIGAYMASLGWLWSVIAAFVASREALDLTVPKTLVATLAAFIAGFFLFVFFSYLLGILYLPFAM